MAIRYITKGKGKNRKTFPIRPKKKGVTVRSVSLRPSAVVKVNREQIKLLNRGEPATFSKALNQVIIRARREGIPIYDTHVNSNDRRKPYHMWIVKHPEKGDKVKGSDTIVMAEHYGQAIDDMITVWNKENRKKITIGYPVVQGTADKSFRYARDPKIQKLELLEPFLPSWTDPNGIKARYAHFDKLPVGIAESLLTGEPNIDAKSNQNNSPNARELVNLAKKHNGTVGGYFINTSDKSRDDHRITLETIYLKMNKKDAEALREKIFPDEFNQQKDGTWRFWWD